MILLTLNQITILQQSNVLVFYKKHYGNDYYALAHFSKYMQVGAVRVDSTDTGADSDYKLCNVVVANPDGTMTAVIVNSNKEDVTCKMVMGAQVMEVNAPAKSTITITWEAECK